MANTGGANYEAFFGIINDPVAHEAIEEEKTARQLFEEAQANIHFNTTCDLYIDHAVDPEYHGERYVRCHRILVPPHVYCDVEASDTASKEELAKREAYDWLEDNLVITTDSGFLAPPAYSVDVVSELGDLEPEGKFSDGYDPEKGFDIDRAVEKYDPTQAPWYDDEEDGKDEMEVLYGTSDHTVKSLSDDHEDNYAIKVDGLYVEFEQARWVGNGPMLDTTGTSYITIDPDEVPAELVNVLLKECGGE